MSIRLRTGFRVSLTSIAELAGLLTPYRETVLGHARQRTLKFLALRSVTILDQRTLGIALDDQRSPSASGSPLYVANDEMDDRRRSARAYDTRDSEVDMEVKVVCRYHPAQKAVLGFVLAGDSGTAYAELLKLPGVSEYQYSDGCVDVPEGYTAKEWAARRAAWSWFLSPQASVPFDFVINDPYLRVPAEEVLEAVPELDVRSGVFAKQVLFNEWRADRKAQGLDADDVEGSKTSLLHYLFREDLSSIQALQARLATLADELEGRLVPQDALNEQLTAWPD